MNNGLSGLPNSCEYVPNSFHHIISSHPTDSYHLKVWSQLCQGSSTVEAKIRSWASSLSRLGYTSLAPGNDQPQSCIKLENQSAMKRWLSDSSWIMGSMIILYLVKFTSIFLDWSSCIVMSDTHTQKKNERRVLVNLNSLLSKGHLWKSHWVGA